jgi:nicotinate-nucleotide adenylyltransferase
VELAEEFGWVHVEVPRLEVSSTDLRERVRDGRPLDYLVTEPVLQIVRQRRLYQDAS